MQSIERICGWMAVIVMCFGMNQVLAAGDPVAGKTKAAVCSSCHGVDGNSENATSPRLAGQYADYIVKQINNFQKGLRTNNEIMTAKASTVASVQDAKDIGAYFSEQKMASKPLSEPSKKLIAEGDKLFHEGKPTNNVYGCVNCHGERGRGKAPNVSVFPVIGGQHRDYIIKQLHDLQAGRRTNDPAGMMEAIAKGLSDQDIQALAAYLSSLL